MNTMSKALNLYYVSPFAPDDIVCLVAGITDISLKIHENCSFIEILVCGYLQLLNVVFVSIIWQL